MTSKPKRRPSWLTAILLVCLSFMGGVLYVEYLFRDIPRTVSYVMLDDKSALLYNNWEKTNGSYQKILAANEVALNNLTNLLQEYESRFNGGRPIAPDRYQDLYKAFQKRSRALKEIEAVQQEFRQSSTKQHI